MTEISKIIIFENQNRFNNLLEFLVIILNRFQMLFPNTPNN